MSDRHVAAQDRGHLVRAVDHRVVLHVAAFPDHDLRLVAPQHGSEPHAGAGLDFDIADQNGGGSDVSVGVHARPSAVELELRHPYNPKSVPEPSLESTHG